MFDARDLSRAIIEQTHAPKASVEVAILDGDLVVVLTGFTPGASLSYAARRRRLAKRIVRKAADEIKLKPVLRCNWSDGITRIEGAISAIMQSSFGVQPQSVVVSVGKHSRVDVRVTFAERVAVTSDLPQQMQTLVASLVAGAGGHLRERGLYLSIPEEIGTSPSLAEVVRAVRIRQPISLGGLLAVFTEGNYPLLTSHKLNSQLDLARQRGLIAQIHGRLFAVTAQGIEASLSTKGRNSADVLRALALGHRRVYDLG